MAIHYCTTSKIRMKEMYDTSVVRGSQVEKGFLFHNLSENIDIIKSVSPRKNVSPSHC